MHSSCLGWHKPCADNVCPNGITIAESTYAKPSRKARTGNYGMFAIPRRENRESDGTGYLTIIRDWRWQCALVLLRQRTWRRVLLRTSWNRQGCKRHPYKSIILARPVSLTLDTMAVCQRYHNLCVSGLDQQTIRW